MSSRQSAFSPASRDALERTGYSVKWNQNAMDDPASRAAITALLGHSQLEKYLYDGLAVLVGRFPKVRVASVSALFDGVEDVRFLMRTVLWLVRGLSLLVPLTVLVHLGVAWSRSPNSSR